MGVREAHGSNPTEVNKYNAIHSLDFFSIAIYHFASQREPMKAFRHKHDEYEFFIPVSTAHLWIQNGFRVIGEVGFIYPVEPNVIHGFDHDLNKTDFVSITISKEYLLKEAALLGHKEKHFLNRIPADLVFYYLMKDYRDSSHSEFPDKPHLEDVAREITDYLIKNGFALDKHRDIPTREYNPSIRKALSYMFENYRDPDLNLAKLANYCGYSVAYFSRVFKQYVGDSPITHLNKIRVSEARALFFNENLSLGDIATLVGFRNLSTFTEAFKTITGEKPKMFRDRTFKR